MISFLNKRGRCTAHIHTSRLGHIHYKEIRPTASNRKTCHAAGKTIYLVPRNSTHAAKHQPNTTHSRAATSTYCVLRQIKFELKFQQPNFFRPHKRTAFRQQHQLTTRSVCLGPGAMTREGTLVVASSCPCL